MKRLYACIISPDAKRDRDALLLVAQQFSYSIELLEDGILFDVSGLQNLVGNVNEVSQKILAELKNSSISGRVAVADTIDTATLLARGNAGQPHDPSSSSNPKSKIQNPKLDSNVASADGVVTGYVVSPDNFAQLSLHPRYRRR